MKKKIGVILSGCGFKDGSEIHEATCALLAIDKAGAEAVCFAPNINQRMHVNHLDGEQVPNARNVLQESARIARGHIADLHTANADELDALVMPGGAGAAMNLSTFAQEGENCEVNEDLLHLIEQMHIRHKPIAAICIAPATLAKALQDIGVSATLTIGDDAETAKKITAMGHSHENCRAVDCVIDRDKNIVTTPAYMNAKSIGEVWSGVEKLVDAVVKMIS
ncbi:MAG: isoprenoid biosynthesis protein ElbB [Deltaproteobacteria bacterium CG11_big_fil_rev_8_21_14_0_20_42_23]|nr:MAG: isoprenoid biosynthesis protein ElbB [Deltaproteobacteria bacterium CG11_big_fil_rev_8_21_14_0_20_42_23]PJC64098.1 MAG: isoprenoid biosynthesis protein ElbB [Deltaproteobacteria bacterium CG_4_9_14_0_2_um_filter_42_21]